MTSTALTRWLRQGLVRGMCPLCRVAHKADREYIWHFFEEYSAHAEALDELQAGRGFCADHAEQLQCVEVDGLKSTLGISETYLDVLEGVAEELERMGPSDPFERAPCPACANREQELRRNAGYLLADLRESDRSRELFVVSPGFCFPHFELVWASADADQRSFVLDVQRRSLRRLGDDLREHVRKQGDEARHEPKGAEQDSWLRAIHLTGGWPRPAHPAGVPEARA